MATFPSYVVVRFAGFSQQDSNLIERSDMDKGVAKTRRVQTDPVVTVSATLYFRSATDVQRYRQWFYSAGGANAGAGWFDMTDPRTLQVRQCRLIASSNGPLTPLAKRFTKASQTVAFEYVEAMQ